jgi:RHS repeat-associated protein
MDSTYAGHQYDQGASLYHARYRSYSPAMSHWLGRDPKGMTDGPNMYAYTGDNPANRVDISGGEWDTLEFVHWYYYGQGSSVNLKNTGLLDNYKNYSPVKFFIAHQKTRLEDLAVQKAQGMSSMCMFYPKSRQYGYVSNMNRESFNFAFGTPWGNPLWALGRNQLRQNGRCTVTLDCSTRQYTFTCSSNFNMNDSFRDPADMERWIRIPIDPGIPYDIYAYWTDTWSGGGQVRANPTLH